MCKCEMDPLSIVEDTEQIRFCPQTDKVKPVLPPSTLLSRGDKTVLVSTLEYLKVPGQDAFTKPTSINTMIYRICYQIFVTYVISNTVWNKVRHTPWLVRSVAKDHTMNASFTRWMCLRRRLMPLAHRKLQLDWTPLDYLVYITCVVPVNLAPNNTRTQAWRRGNLHIETRDDNQQTQRTEDEEPEEESTTSTEDPSHLQPQTTPGWAIPPIQPHNQGKLRALVIPLT